MAELIEMAYVVVTQVGPRNYVLDGGADLPRGSGNELGKKWWPIVSRDCRCNASA